MLLGSIGLALHLLLLQMLGIETSLLLVAGTSHPLAVVAFLAELMSELCYAELLAEVLEAETLVHAPPHRDRYGAAHLLPEGGVAATAKPGGLAAPAISPAGG